MMYSEFVKGTGCRENEHNYKVFKDLEVMYMNSDLTKEQIYEYGKKLVDNSKTEAELMLETQVKEEIEDYKRQIEQLKEEVNRFTDYMKTEEDVVWKATWRDRVRAAKKDIEKCRFAIQHLKWVIA